MRTSQTSTPYVWEAEPCVPGRVSVPCFTSDTCHKLFLPRNHDS